MDATKKGFEHGPEYAPEYGPEHAPEHMGHVGGGEYQQHPELWTEEERKKAGLGK